MQHVRVMQNCLKAVEKHGHEGLNLEVERTKCPEEKGCRNVRGKKDRRHTHSVAQAQVQQEVIGDLVQG